MASEIDLWVVLPLCVLGFAFWAGMYVYITLTVMRLDPREIEQRKNAGDSLGILPSKIAKSETKEKDES